MKESYEQENLQENATRVRHEQEEQKTRRKDSENQMRVFKRQYLVTEFPKHNENELGRKMHEYLGLGVVHRMYIVGDGWKNFLLELLVLVLSKDICAT